MVVGFKDDVGDAFVQPSVGDKNTQKCHTPYIGRADIFLSRGASG
jgi:hypothetical protein